MKVGIESKEKIVRSFNEYERKASELRGWIWVGIQNCALYRPSRLVPSCGNELSRFFTVRHRGKPIFMYPGRVIDYGAICQYDCDVKCDADIRTGRRHPPRKEWQYFF